MKGNLFMNKYRRFLPYIESTAFQNVARKLKRYSPLHNHDHPSPVSEPEQKHQEYYEQELYEGNIQSGIYQTPEEHIDESGIQPSRFTHVFPQIQNDNITSEPLEEEQIDMLAPSQEIEDAIDLVKNDKIQDSISLLEDSNLLNNSDCLENIVNESLQQDDLMNELEEQLLEPMLYNMFYFNPPMF